MRTPVLAAACLATALFSSAWADDRPPVSGHSSERAEIETMLRDRGFTSWGEIERDDGKWEVDDAIGSDGLRYELEFAVGTLKLMKLERD